MSGTKVITAADLEKEGTSYGSASRQAPEHGLWNWSTLEKRLEALEAARRAQLLSPAEGSWADRLDKRLTALEIRVTALGFRGDVDFPEPEPEDFPEPEPDFGDRDLEVWVTHDVADPFGVRAYAHAWKTDEGVVVAFSQEGIRSTFANEETLHRNDVIVTEAALARMGYVRSR